MVDEARKAGQWERIVALAEAFLARGPTEPAQDATVLGWQAKALRRLGKDLKAARALYDGLDLAREANLPLQRAELLADLSAIVAERSDRYRFEQLMKEYEAIAAEWPAVSSLRYEILRNWGVCLEWLGDLEGAVSAYRQCLEVCSNCQAADQMVRAAKTAHKAVTNLAGILLWLDRTGEAEPLLEQARNTASYGLLQVVMTYEAHLFLNKGNHFQALTRIAEAFEMPGTDSWIRADLHLTRAMVLLDQERVDVARLELESAMACANQARPRNALALRRAILLLREHEQLRAT